MRTRILALIAAIAALMAVATPAQAIKNGVPDAGAHPYVGELLFYVPSEEDPRFDDPGAWFTCSGTLVSPTIVVTAGHCTFDIGHNGADGADTGGNDVWISFAEEPNFDILTPSSTFAPDDNAGRYDAWSEALNESTEWIRATAYHHPDYDNDAFFTHDLGVLRLSEPVTLSEYGQLPTEGLLDELYADNKQQLYTAVGYGLEGAGPKKEIGGDTRRRAELKLVNLNGVLGTGKGTSAKFSSNAKTGGTCFGDSGGPIFVSGTNTIVAVTSFGANPACAGTSGAYRIDQEDDLAWLATFGVTP
jgi:Trypsin